MKKIALLFIGPALIIVIIYSILIGGSDNDGPNEQEINFARLMQIEKALVSYHKSCGQFPSNEQGLTALVRYSKLEPLCKAYPAEAFLPSERDLIDAYGHPIQYENMMGSAFLKSLGADGKTGGEQKNKDLELSIDI